MPAEPDSASRRTLLAAVATLPVAGCLGGDGRGTPTEDDPTTSTTTGEPNPTEPTTLEVGETYDTGDYAVRVASPAVRHGIVEFGTTHPDPRWEDGAQFLVVDLAVEDGGPDPSTLPVRAETDQGPVRERYFVSSSSASETRQPIGFPIPTSTALGAVSVRLQVEPPVRWRLPDDVVETLRHAPEFALESFAVPESARPEAAVDASLSVTNVGQRDGRFLAELGPTAMSDQSEIEHTVSVGETSTTTHSVPVRFFESETAEVVLRWEGGVERRTVRKE